MRGIPEVASDFHRACDDAGVPYCFVGALAVMAWGEPRATTDADALVHVQPSNAPAFVQALRAQRLDVELRDVLSALEDGGHLTVFAEDSPFHVDVKPARQANEFEEIERAMVVELSTGKVRVVPPEETIAYKLAFGSPKDLQDALSVLVRQADSLDRPRLHSLVVQLGVADKLRRLEEQRQGKP